MPSLYGQGCLKGVKRNCLVEVISIKQVPANPPTLVAIAACRLRSFVQTEFVPKDLYCDTQLHSSFNRTTSARSSLVHECHGAMFSGRYSCRFTPKKVNAQPSNIGYFLRRFGQIDVGFRVTLRLSRLSPNQLQQGLHFLFHAPFVQFEDHLTAGARPGKSLAFRSQSGRLLAK
jgi:hypothetical protein